MKKLILLLLLVPIFAMGQGADPIPYKDTITYERDTIVKFILSDNYTGHIYFIVDSLAGTLDGVAELVVADDVNNNSPTTYPADSLFLRYTSAMTKTLSANGAYSFAWDTPLGYDFVGLKLSKNNITKWHINYKARLRRDR